MGPDDAGVLNAILGGLFFGSVTVKPAVVSCTRSVTVPLTCDDTVKFAWPLVTLNVAGGEPPFIFAFESPELIDTLIVSDETAFLLQSRITTSIC